jgi:predicted DNA-binding protein YlxM (UPF0122 family)
VPSDLVRLRRLTARMARLASTQSALAAERRQCVAALLKADWSLARIADAIGVSKAAIQKLAP